MLDHGEFTRWIEASDDEGRVARDLVGLGAFNSVVLHSEQAAQLALKGLLRGVGAAREAWGHALPELAGRAVEAAGLVVSEDLTASLGVLARDYMPSRYPDALVSGTPRGSYGLDDAQRALATLAHLRAAIVDTWERLLDDESDHGDDPEGET